MKPLSGAIIDSQTTLPIYIDREKLDRLVIEK
jgi:hypothetical protein